MKTYGKVALLLVLILVSSLALAKWVGRFYCGSSCTFDTPFASGDTYAFIFSDVNQSVDSWVDSSGNANTVTICNGAVCATYRYIKLSGQFQYTGYYYSSWKGENVGGGGSGPGELPGLPGGGAGGHCTIGSEARLACTSVGEPQGASTSGQVCEWVQVDVLIC